MEFIHRVKERDQALEPLRAENGFALAVVGGRGSGRSHLLGEIAAVIGIPSVTVSANVREASWPLSGLSAVLSAMDRALGTSLIDTFAGMDESTPDITIAHSLLAELRRLLDQPLVVLVDDADRFDEKSQLVLGYFVRRLGSSPLRVVLAVRSTQEGSPFAGHAEVVLEPLHPASLVAFARTLAPASASPSVLDFVARVSSGSAMALASIIGTLTPAELEGEVPLSVPLRPGQRLRLTHEETVQDLNPEALHALRVVAAGTILPAEIAWKVPGLTGDGMEELITLELVRRSAHLFIASDSALNLAVYWSTPAAQRLAIHQQLAELGEEVDPGLWAWHTSHVNPSCDLAGPLLRAARDLVEGGETLQGIRLAERALSLSPPCEQVSLLEGLIRALLLHTEVLPAHRYLRLILGKCPHTALTLRTGTLRLFLDFLHRERVDSDLICSVVTENSADDPVGTARFLGKAVMCRLVSWDIAGARYDVERARALAGPAATPEGAACLSTLERLVGLFEDAVAGRPLPSVRDLEGLPEQVEDLPLGLGPVQILIARVLMLGERFDDARRQLDLFRDIAGGMAPVWSALALDVSFGLEFRSVQLEQAASVVDLMAQESSICPHSRRLSRSEVAMVQGEAGVLAAGVEQLGRSVGAGTSYPVRMRMILLQARAAQYSGDLPGAVLHFALAREVEEAAGFRNPQLMRYLDQYIEVLHRLGRTDRAQALQQEFEEHAAAAPSRWAGRAVRRTRSLFLPGEEALVELQEILEDWADRSDDFVHAQTLATQADRLQQLGQSARAAEARRRRAALLTAMGWDPAALSLDPEEDGTTVRGEGLLAALTSKEREVVELLARGYKNQVIARELFLSVRTIELRLTSIYRKVGVSSRFELLRLLHSSGAEGDGAPADGR